MPFEKVQPARLADAVVSQIELLILRGILRPGERLPSERDLSEKLGVSRPSLRDAIADLQARGLIGARAGAGMFVSETLNAVFPPELARLFANHPEAAFDYIAFRRDMEGLAAERAARHGTQTDLTLIAALLGKMERAHSGRDPSVEAQLDAEFHLAIVEASHNLVMLHMMRSMYDLLRYGVFYNRQIMFGQRTTRSMLLDQHRAINTAIQNRDPAAARKAVETHLTFVEQALAAHQKAQHHEQIARKRLDHEEAR